jgi:tetratricopeptide (TPR) repeat protein
MIDEQRLQKAIELHGAGQFDEAWQIYKELSAANPDDAGLVHLMGVLAGQVGNLLESVRLIQLAIAKDPDAPDFYKNLAITYNRLENRAKAASVFNDMGVTLTRLERLEEAVEAHARAVELDPRSDWLMNNLGASLNRIGRFAEALDVLRRAAAPDVNMPRDLAHWPKAKKGEVFTKQLPGLHLNMGLSLHGLGDYQGALDAYERVLTLQPDSVLAHHNRGITQLTLGDYKNGLAGFEWRWRQDDYKPKRNFPQPVWRGESPEELGGKLLIITEQGFGDAVQFCRFIPILAAKGYDIIWEVREDIYPLLYEGFWCPGVRLVLASDDPERIAGDPDFAAYIGLLSLPHLLGITLDTIPADVPYLYANPTKTAAWKGRFAHEHRLKVGLVWGGNPRHLLNYSRSMPPHFWEPAVSQKDVAFYSLQKGPAAQYRFPFGKVITLDPELTDFTETAAAIDNLDLVIGVDTSVIHIAAALGKPAWVMVPQTPDWRWGAAGDTTPWYPTVRIFRQEGLQNWPSVVVKVAAALKQLSDDRR